VLDPVKFGATVTLAGFLMVGSAVLYVNLTPLPTTPEGLLAWQAVARNWGIVQGLGWILAGIGLYLALLGSAKSDTAIDTKSEILLGRLPPRKSKFVCEKCGGDVSQETTRCPHCGSPLEE